MRRAPCAVRRAPCAVRQASGVRPEQERQATRIKKGGRARSRAGRLSNSQRSVRPLRDAMRYEAASGLDGTRTAAASRASCAAARSCSATHDAMSMSS
ncbi:hypothetical protein X949_5449 [Burkholderia pseudomallei MSHR5609]|nr:hypothetical protein X949_5449 [Burkholderia pseudomallei MSHR5609]